MLSQHAYCVNALVAHYVAYCRWCVRGNHLNVFKTIRDYYRSIAPASMLDEVEHALDQNLTPGDRLLVIMAQKRAVKVSTANE